MSTFIVTATGTGVSGNTLPHTGTITFTTRFAETGNSDNDYIYPYIYAIDKNGNELAQAHPANNYGGSWESGYRFYINTSNVLTGSVTVDVGIFKSKLSSYSNLAGLRFKVSPSSTTHDLESFDFPFKITACGAPTACGLSASTSTGSNATLSWSGASAGELNAITGYEVQRCESSDGSTWGSWEALKTVSASGTSGSTSVLPPSTAGNYYKYRVRTMGAEGSGYYSGWKESGTLRRMWTACGAPTACSLSENSSAGKEVTLSWSGATAGYGNAITGYEVQRCESSDGSTWGSWATLSNPTASPLSVSPPSTYGHYYKYRVRTKGAAGSAYYSGWTESGTLMRGRPALLSYTDPDLVAGVTKVKAAHISELQENVNRMRESLGLSSYTFTTIQAGYTSLAGWSAHVAELRTAIDEMSSTHETWIAISVNCPTVAVMEQLRRVVAAI